MKTLKLSREELQRIFDVTGSSISKDPARRMCQYARVSVYGERLIAAALDSYKLSKLTITLQEPAKQNFEFFIRPFKFSKDLQSAEIVYKDRANVELVLKYPNIEISQALPQLTEGFANVESFIPETDDMLSVSVNAEMLIALLKPFAKSEDPNRPVRLSFVKSKGGINPSKPILLSCNVGENEHVEAILMPLRDRR